MKVVEIFKSIDGEGIRTGFPVTFIRLEGCNLRCSYCDTKYSYDDAEYKEMSIDNILEKVKELNCPRITLTGGEPLIHKDVAELIKQLCENGYEVNIETNGSQFLRSAYMLDDTIITMDYKCPSSGMTNKMCYDNFELLREKDILKFVVGNKEDLDVCKKILDTNSIKAQIFISPIFGSIEPKEIVDYILKYDMYNCRIQVQLHKIIWDPNERGV